MKQRRYPIREGELVIDMRGKVGRVKALIDLGDGLPRATVEWLDVGESTMPLGYLESAERGGLE